VAETRVLKNLKYHKNM